MKAFLIATGVLSDTQNEPYPSALLPLLDRPFIQHVIEFLTNQGVDHFDIVISDFPEKIEALIGDGKRWGITVIYHLVKNPTDSYKPLRYIDVADVDNLLLVHTDRLISLDLLESKIFSGKSDLLLYSYLDESDEKKESSTIWTGWACLSRQYLPDKPEGMSKTSFGDYLTNLSEANIKIVDSDLILNIQSYQDFLNVHKILLSKKIQGLAMTANEVEPGIWLSRNINLHPTAHLIPPVYIGQDCRIDKGVFLGPNAIIGHNCVIDSDSTITESVIFSGSYVGQGLELSQVMVDRNQLINTHMGTDITIVDDFILGSLAEKNYIN